MTATDLYGVLRDGFADRLDQPAFVLPDTTVVMTYRQLDERTARVARALVGLGVGKGDRVAFQVDKSIETVVAYLGSLRAGAVFLPLNTAYQRDEVAYFLGDAEPTVAVGRPSAPWFCEVARASGVRTVLQLDASGKGSWAELIDATPTGQAGSPVPVIAGDDLACLVYTSGTTGRSKGAMISHGNLVANARALVELWGFEPADRMLHALPIFHVHGLHVALHTSVLSGIPIEFHTSFDPAAIIAGFDRNTVFMGVPTMYVRLLAEASLTPQATRPMRLFISGSAPLLPETFDAFTERTGYVILERYGMTETGMLTSNPFDGVRKRGTVGPPLPGTRVRLVGAGALDSAAGEVGDVQVKGPNVFSGYWRNPEKTIEDFTADGWFRTGDVGMLDPDGYLELVGRSKDLVISGGYNVYPKEIELLLDEMPGVVESAVIGVRHPDFGEGVTAVLVVSPGVVLDANAMMAALKAQLASYKVPKAIEVVDDLPRNAMGKVQKNLLRDRFRDLYATPPLG